VPLRIVHLVTSLNGGAGIAANRLAAIQNDSGMEAFILGPKPEEKRIFRSLISKAITFLQMKIATKRYEIVTPISLSSIPMNEIDKWNPDVVHIHNWYNILNESSILEISKKYPLVFTLHDQRLFTGGCHNAFDCEGFRSGCKECPATKLLGGLVARSHSNLGKCFKSIERYALIAPSQWILNLALDSGQFPNATSFSRIPNAIELSNIRPPIEKTLVTELRLLFVSAQLDIPLKGLNTLIVALKEITESKSAPNPKILLTLVGDSRKAHRGQFGELEIRQFARLDSEEVVTQMHLNDLLVIPSLSENSPNVVAEAQLCGLVVAGSNVGGIPELIEHKKTGLLFTPDIKGTLNAVLEFAKLSRAEVDEIRVNAQQEAKSRYDREKILQLTNDVYRKLMAENNA